MIDTHQTQHREAQRIVVPKPPVGAKAEVFESKGLYVLEEGPGDYLQTVCAHAGSGHVEIFDGRVEGSRIIGRKLFRASPMAMGVWHLNAGFQHGLVIDAGGGQQSLGAHFTAVWYTKNDGQLTFPRKCSHDLTQFKGTRILTTRDAILYSVVIATQGSGQFTVRDGHGRKLYAMPSSFTGSFLLENVFAADGIVLELNFSVPPAITFNWKEQEPDDLEPIPPKEHTDGRRATDEHAHNAPDTHAYPGPAANSDATVSGRGPGAGPAAGYDHQRGDQGSGPASDAGQAAPVGSQSRSAEGGDQRPEPSGSPAAPRGKHKPRR